MRVLLTGASSGIGLATARELAERGADVALLARGREGLERAAAEVRSQGRTAVVLTADVTDPDAVSTAVATAAEELGGLDAVIANAGAAAYGELRETPVEDVQRTVEVTLLGAWHTVAAALPHLERTGGTIVATGSVAALQPQPLMAAYSAAKHGLRALLESLRLELANAGSPVRVALVHPGPVDTPFWQHVTPSGPMPPELPWAYSPAQVARALADAVERPHDRTVGLAMRGLGVLRTLARPVSDLGLASAARWALRNAAPVTPGRVLREPAGDGTTTGGVRA